MPRLLPEGRGLMPPFLLPEEGLVLPCPGPQPLLHPSVPRRLPRTSNLPPDLTFVFHATGNRLFKYFNLILPNVPLMLLGLETDSASVCQVSV